MSTNSNELNEPSDSHRKKEVKFFSSFEEMENDQLAYYASRSPEELLRNHKILSMAAFGLQQEPEADAIERKIKFRKDE